MYRYFYHATDERKDSPEYDLEDQDEEALEMAESPEPEETAHVEVQSMDVDRDEKKAKEEEVDPSIADWFQVTKEKTPERSDPRYNDDSETEPDSENEDVKDEDEDIDDDWVDLPPSSVSQRLYSILKFDSLMLYRTGYGADRCEDG